jgi:C_GCAxxG_C_C family probable redox protein
MDIDKISARGEELFGSGYNCAQAVFAACAPEFGLAEDAALKTAAAFGGGIARSGNICGALSGALMALGMKRSPAEPGSEVKAANYARAQALMTAFGERCGARTCRDLTGCDLATAEGSALFASRGLGKTLCPKLVETAIALVAEA